MRADDDAVARLVCPLTVSVDAVVEARDVAPVVVNPVVDALPSVDCPVTESVPLDTSEEVAVIVPPVKELITPVTAERSDEKNDVAVALVREVLPRVDCPLTVSAVADAVLSTVCPLTVRLVDDAFPSVDVPEVSVFTVPVVAVRLVTVAFVVVELPTMRLVKLASVATSDEMKELVVVAEVE